MHCSCAWRHCAAFADAQEALDELDSLIGVFEPFECLFCLDIVERSFRDILAVTREFQDSKISIPNYGPATMTSTTDLSELGTSSMMSGGFGGGAEGGMNESLLGGPPQQGNYSMAEYFQTFVLDVYGLFRSLPILAQIILLVFLLFLVIKLI